MGSLAIYEGDSFFTLSLWGRAALITLSAILALLLCWLVVRLGRGRSLALRLWIAMVVFWAFLWVSPQIYYLYYMTLIDGLPWQNVIGAPPSLTGMLSLLTFTDTPSLSNHAQGALGWGLAALCLWRGKA